MNYGNLTLILKSYSCDKRCPFCIAKNNCKFNKKSDHLENLEILLEKMSASNIRFDNFVLSGNGEPSLYDMESLKYIKNIITKYQDLFNLIRIHTSGNIFFENEKFWLFNSLENKVQFSILRLALDPKTDMNLLNYVRDYLESRNFIQANNIKCDIALTRYLDVDNIEEKLKNFLQEHGNIKSMHFKKLMIGDNEDSKQATWIRRNMLSDNQISYIKGEIEDKFPLNLSFEQPGNYSLDLVINGGELMNYNEKSIKVSELVK